LQPDRSVVQGGQDAQETETFERSDPAPAAAGTALRSEIMNPICWPKWEMNVE